MAWYSMLASQPVPPDVQRQVAVHQLLLTARSVWLSDALRDALGEIDQARLKAQIVEFVPAEAQQLPALAGIRDEVIFPTPILLEAKPTLVAYYRLLVGVSKKRFYTPATGMSPFQRLEDGSPITPTLAARLPAFCSAMCHALTELVMQAGSSIEARDIEDLQLLTLGSYYYGSLNNTIGQTATLGVFNAVLEIVGDLITDRGKDWINLTTPVGRDYSIRLASDPDMRLVELGNGVERPLVSIEIKGGTDKANAYNRGGEAEKSHQGARSRGYMQCWTIIHLANVDFEKLKQGSPTTTEWFDANEIISRNGNDWLKFEAALKTALNLP